MRLGSFAWIVLLVGCAGQPPAAPPPLAAQPPAVAAPAAASPAQPKPAPETHRVKVDAFNVVEVQRAGYKLVNKDGQSLFCRTDFITGSHVRTTTICLTEQELTEQMNTTQQSMAGFNSHNAGPAHR